MNFNKWLNKGEGGEWYEPYIANKDLILISTIAATFCGIIIVGFCILDKSI